MKCFYHGADLDGHASGAIIKKAEPAVELIGYDYGNAFPWETIDPEETVYMVDVSLPIADMVKLARLLNAGGGRFVWIDHHISAIRDFEAIPEEDRDLFDGIRETDRAACELCWEYVSLPGSNPPPAIELLGIYDSWRFTPETEQRVKEWQYGMRMRGDTRPETCPDWWENVLEWSDVDSEGFHEVMAAGQVVYAYQVSQNKKTCSSCAFDTLLMVGPYRQETNGGFPPALRCIAINSNLMSSDVFKDAYDPQRHDAMLCFYRSNRGFWRVSIYSDRNEIDCSIYAKSYGGGGHKGAAGFRTEGDLLPFCMDDLKAAAEVKRTK